MSGFGERIVRAAKLDRQLYEEVEVDPKALGQALGVVVLSSIAAGIGSIHMTSEATERGFASAILLGAAGAIVGWFIWAYLTYLIGAKLLPEPQTQANPGQLLRTIGFSSSPGIMRILGIVPLIGYIVFVIASAWMIAAMVVAVRQALDYESTWRAVGVTLVAWVIQAILIALLFALVGGQRMF
jgi:hypothetical protein